MVLVYILVGVVLLFGVLALLAPKKFDLERSIVVDRPIEQVHARLRSLRDQDKWSTWSSKDPNMVRTYRGAADGEIGLIAHWVGNKQVGEGEQALKKVADHRIDFELRFLKPFKATNDAYFLVEPAPSGTKVTWGFHSDFHLPTSIIFMFMNMEKMMGPEFGLGLKQFKAHAEAE